MHAIGMKHLETTQLARLARQRVVSLLPSPSLGSAAPEDRLLRSVESRFDALHGTGMTELVGRKESSKSSCGGFLG